MFKFFTRSQETPRHVSPKVRAYGRARLDIARRASTPEEWQALWKKPQHSFPFEWGQHWRQCVEYKVDDFAAEVGFFIDVLGLPVNAFDENYAMFTGPGRDFYFAVVPVAEGSSSTPPGALRIQFMVADIFGTVEELERRGIAFEQPPQPLSADSSLHVATFRTPHGIYLELWGEASPVEAPQPVEQAGFTTLAGYTANTEEVSQAGEPAVSPILEEDGDTEEDWELEGEEDLDDNEEELTQVRPTASWSLALQATPPAGDREEESQEPPDTREAAQDIEYVDLEAEDPKHPYRPIPLSKSSPGKTSTKTGL